MASWVILRCEAEKPALLPMRLAGTWKQYSTKAMSQLTRIASPMAERLKRRWPYQAKVMKTLETVSSRAVRRIEPCLVMRGLYRRAGHSQVTDVTEAPG